MNELDLVKTRLDQILNEQNISKAELAKIARVTPQAVNNWYKKGNIGIDSAKAIYEKYGYQIEWILGGNIEPSNNLPHRSLSDELIKDTKDSSHLHRIDYFDVYAAAGLSGFENADYPEIISSLFLSDEGMAQLIGRKSSNGICLVNVPTDSMEPTIRKGDLVFLDTNVNFYNGDGIYAFVIDGALFIKRIQKLVGGGYRLHSDNKNGYDPQDITEDIYQSAKFIGRFIRTIHVEAVNL